MQKYTLIFVIGLLLIVFLCSFKIIETFVVPMNSDSIDESPIEPSKDLETLIDIFKDKFNNVVELSNLQTLKELNSGLTKQIYRYIRNQKYNLFIVDFTHLSKFMIDLSTPFEKIEYKYTEPTEENKEVNEAILKFETVLVLNNYKNADKILNFSANKVEVTLKLTTVDSSINFRQLDLLKNFKDDYISSIKYEILNIKPLKPAEIAPSKFKAVDVLQGNNFNITNSLHLLTPFTTSYDEMIITEAQKKIYEESIPEIKDIQAPIYKPFIE